MLEECAVVCFGNRAAAVGQLDPGVGEIGESQRGMQTQNAYTSNGRLHMAYDFDFLSTVYPSGGRIRQVLERFDRIVTEGWACWAFSNHDVVRHATRFDLNVAQRKLYAASLMTLKGTICLYQGEELGFTEAYVGFEALQDPYGKRFWPKFKGRDGCRTPIAWNRDANGGFSDVRPWLPVALEHIESSASHQEGDPGSVLTFYRAFIAFRKGHTALAKGDLTVLEADDERLVFTRTHGDGTVWVAFNLTSQDMTVALPSGDWSLLDTAPFTHTDDGTGVILPAWQGAFATPRH